MKTRYSFPEIENQLSRPNLKNAQFVRAVQILSRVITLLFLVSLAWAIYQAAVNGDPLPTWVWLGIVILFAVAIGLIVAVIVYHGVAQQAGPFDYRTSNRVAGEIKRAVQMVEVNGAKSLHAEIKMTQGVLQLMGGATEVMVADFTYDEADWKPPVVEYAVNDNGEGELVVEQKATGRPAMRQGRCEWVIRLNQDLPIELSVKFGAGNADLKLGGLPLDRLWVESGVGELVLDLSGEWNRSMEAFIKAGIGDTILRLPQDAGVRVRSTVGLGSIEPHGLTREGKDYTNALYGQSSVTLNITIEGGIGKINIREN